MKKLKKLELLCIVYCAIMTDCLDVTGNGGGRRDDSSLDSLDRDLYGIETLGLDKNHTSTTNLSRDSGLSETHLFEEDPSGEQAIVGITIARKQNVNRSISQFDEQKPSADPGAMSRSYDALGGVASSLPVPPPRAKRRSHEFHVSRDSGIQSFEDQGFSSSGGAQMLRHSASSQNMGATHCNDRVSVDSLGSLDEYTETSEAELANSREDFRDFKNRHSNIDLGILKKSPSGATLFISEDAATLSPMCSPSHEKHHFLAEGSTSSGMHNIKSRVDKPPPKASSFSTKNSSQHTDPKNVNGSNIPGSDTRVTAPSDTSKVKAVSQTGADLRAQFKHSGSSRSESPMFPIIQPGEMSPDVTDVTAPFHGSSPQLSTSPQLPKKSDFAGHTLHTDTRTKGPAGSRSGLVVNIKSASLPDTRDCSSPDTGSPQSSHSSQSQRRSGRRSPPPQVILRQAFADDKMQRVGLTAQGVDIHPAQLRGSLHRRSMPEEELEAVVAQFKEQQPNVSQRQQIVGPAARRLILAKQRPIVLGNRSDSFAEKRPSYIEMRKAISLEKSSSDTSLLNQFAGEEPVVFKRNQPPTYQEAMQRKSQLNSQLAGFDLDITSQDIVEQTTNSARAKKLYQESLRIYEEQADAFCGNKASKDNANRVNLPSYELACQRAKAIKESSSLSQDTTKTLPPSYDKHRAAARSSPTNVTADNSTSTRNTNSQPGPQSRPSSRENFRVRLVPRDSLRAHKNEGNKTSRTSPERPLKPSLKNRRGSPVTVGVRSHSVPADSPHHQPLIEDPFEENSQHPAITLHKDKYVFQMPVNSTKKQNIARSDDRKTAVSTKNAPVLDNQPSEVNSVPKEKRIVLKSSRNREGTPPNSFRIQSQTRKESKDDRNPRRRRVVHRLSDPKLSNRNTEWTTNLTRSKSDSSDHLNRTKFRLVTVTTKGHENKENQHHRNKQNTDTAQSRSRSHTPERIVLEENKNMKEGRNQDLKVRRRSVGAVSSVRNRDWHKEMAEQYDKEKNVQPLPPSSQTIYSYNKTEEVAGKRRWSRPVHPTKDLIVRSFDSASQTDTDSSGSGSHKGSRSHSRTAEKPKTVVLHDRSSQKPTKGSAGGRTMLGAVEQQSTESDPGSVVEEVVQEGHGKGIGWSVAKLRNMYDQSKETSSSVDNGATNTDNTVAHTRRPKQEYV